ncbi:MAG: AAA family ATPase [Candidatus Pacebacteria bacterium]|jgi:UDP-N-acetylglucosamine kinase|nr:AAA family ATPase [Candidatus Paceibacterota bacterium]MBT3511855.1 AAA family ATPase [Candidatus Paceibacterota bacterium]MBT4004430.1 AAA family ATPase [Candidatus Paceibacterota bacterium]MBT4358542.1 AAA family ATPase [Candidatus Paceibacterota bacterium]MBT4680720.1 AAA family ATPase [Candidatus Paceibacterota bacterium]
MNKDAIAYVKKNHKKIVSDICNLKIFSPSKNPFTLFMAGSPGSGKTEYSKNFLKKLEAEDPSQKILRLDTDELRELLPQYTGDNSDEVQRAATLLFDKTFDYIQKKNINAIIDTTFASPRAMQNVERSINRGRRVGIIYLYEDPIRAWEYTKKREKMEGRSVPKDIFINAYFSARQNVNKVKEKFGDRIELNLFEKYDDFNFEKKAKFNIQSLDSHLKERYDRHDLEKKLLDEI